MKHLVVLGLIAGAVFSIALAAPAYADDATSPAPSALTCIGSEEAVPAGDSGTCGVGNTPSLGTTPEGSEGLDGIVGSVVDDVADIVDDATDVLDDTTGGITAPVTVPVDQTVAQVPDVIQQLVQPLPSVSIHIGITPGGSSPATPAAPVDPSTVPAEPAASPLAPAPIATIAADRAPSPASQPSLVRTGALTPAVDLPDRSSASAAPGWSPPKTIGEVLFPDAPAWIQVVATIFCFGVMLFGGLALIAALIEKRRETRS